MPDITVNGARLHYEEHGAGAPIVFLHGALAVGMAFRGQRAALRPFGRLIFLDQRVHGASAHFGEEVPWSTLAYDQFVSDARAFLDAVAPDEPAHLVGVSMGGLVAARVAAEAPHRVASLALLSSAARASLRRRRYFTTTPPEETSIARFGAHWHGEPYWRELAAAVFQSIALAGDDVFPARVRVPRALVMQAVEDELLEPDEADVWAARIERGVTVERPPGTHAFFADGRAGTKAANAALARHLPG
jgi:pimeloyl-ACP methyl ester carboxylesterase